MIIDYRILIIIVLGLLYLERTNGQLWCYECNVDLRNGRNGECNDPYVPGLAANLTVCPQNEQYHCLKSVVLYKNILTTVRACVPSRTIGTYCQFHEAFPQARIKCFFCEDYACNGHSNEGSGILDRLSILVSILIFTFVWNIKFDR